MNALLLLWQTLSQEPTFWLAVTLSAYAAGQALYRASNFNALCSPIIVACALIIALLRLTDTSYATYGSGGHFVHFLLGPATVALAVPLYEQRRLLARLWVPLTCGLVAGAFTAMVSAMGIAALLGASRETIVSLAPKSVTVPIAMGVSETLGGIPTLTAALGVATGLIGAVLCRPVFRVTGETNAAVRGFSLGLSAHGLGTAAAFQLSRQTGAFSGLAMGLTGLVTAFLAPVVVPILLRFL